MYLNETMLQVKNGEHLDITIELDDPTGNSYLQVRHIQGLIAIFVRIWSINAQTEV